MSKITEGPWTVEEDVDGGTTFYWISGPGDYFPVCPEWSIRKKEDAVAIGALPDLMEAARAVLATSTAKIKSGEHAANIKALERAVAKAGGGA